MIIRDMKYSEKEQCCQLVLNNWGPAAADRCHEQCIEMFKGGPYAPHFLVADIGPGIVGFAAFAPTMLMKGAFDLIWIAVHPNYQGAEVGKQLTRARIAMIKARGGQTVQLVTQKPGYFNRFGFVTVLPLGNDWNLMVLKLKQAEI